MVEGRSGVWVTSWSVRLILVVTMMTGYVFPLSCLATERKQQDVSSLEYLVGIGDVLEVSVWNEPEISKVVFVRLDGKISLPLVGDIKALGATPELLSQRIRTAISKFVGDPSVTVTLKESHSRIYYIVGQIAQPGEYSLNTPVSILQAIARAGGFAEWAKKEKVLIVRRSDDHDWILNFNYEEFLNGKGRDKNINVMPGDTIVVP
ncbi:MAG: polysaccharide export protein [Desulfobulbaceae bacterium]|nr:polysaccharide export protein [Desulfobulbaceae bacterium]